MQSRTYANKEYGLAKTSRGFTLVEILVVVMLVAILSAAALPEFSSFMAKRRVNAIVNQLAASVKLARSAAQASGRNASICPVAPDGASCAGGNDWSSGWLVYVVGATPTTVQKIVQVSQLNANNVSVTLPISAGVGMTIAPTGINTSQTEIKVRPNNVSASLGSTLGKTMTFQNVTLELSVADGA